MTYGFFRKDRAEGEADYRPGNPLSCYSCGLYKGVLSPRMQPHGENKKGIIVVGEAPGETEDERGRPWQGKAGRRLRTALDRFNIDLDRDCLSLNSVNCRPPKNRAPTPHEIDCCRAIIVGPALAEAKKSLILLLGSSAVESVIGPSAKKSTGPMNLWRGMHIPDQRLQAWVCPTFHPSYIEREQTRPEILTVWRNDLGAALSTLSDPFPDYRDADARLHVLTDESAVEQILRDLCLGRLGSLAAFDYETTGLKPHAPGHDVLVISFATDAGAWSFLRPRKDRGIRLWRRFLRTGSIKKVSHNLKFEHAWSQAIFGEDVAGWVWDSMIAAHVLDNRPGVAGLKMQTYLNFGVPEYDAEVAPYLKGKDARNANSLNTLRESLEKSAVEQAVLRYCSYDSLYCLWLSQKQMATMGKGDILRA